jgi:tight adherence protein C
MVAFLILVLATGLVKYNYFIVLLLALGLGFLAPDFWLGRRIAKRQREIRRGLPDVLDLLIVCVEAGLSLDQATARTSQELDRSGTALSDEMGVVVLEQRAGCPRSDAWRHLADRTDVDSVRSVVSMLVQSEVFGTSIARTLRVHSETLRTQRIQQVEEQAAKTGIKILFPLVFCIFPNLFLVTLGPAIMLMMDSFSKNLNH